MFSHTRAIIFILNCIVFLNMILVHFSSFTFSTVLIYYGLAMPTLQNDAREYNFKRKSFSLVSLSLLCLRYAFSLIFSKPTWICSNIFYRTYVFCFCKKIITFYNTNNYNLNESFLIV